MLGDIRIKLLDKVASCIAMLPRDHIVRVGVDGIDGAGKTCFADELARTLRKHAVTVIRASVDDFHNPRKIRYYRGRYSPDGFYLDSYDYEAFRRDLLEPLSPGGSGRYRIAAFDHMMDMPVAASEEQALPESILVVDGIFLHRSELRRYWDFSIFLDVAFDISIQRVAARDPHFAFAGPTDQLSLRYVDGQKRYLHECTPSKYAMLMIDNTNFAAPAIIPAVSDRA